MAGSPDNLEGGRVGMELPCRIVTGDRAFPAMLSDLSLEGACVMAPDLPEFMPLGLRAIEVDDIGSLDVIFRWRQGNRVGVSFRTEHDARPRLERFFADHGIHIGAGA